MKNQIVLCILTALLAVSPASAQDNRPGKTAVGVDLRWEIASISAPQPAFTITGIPQFARSVPIHKDDSGDGIRSLTVAASRVSLATYYATGFSFAPQLSLGRLTLRGGGYYTFYNKELFRGRKFARQDFDPGGADYTRDNFHEVNFYGTTARGTGQSLVYYGVKVRPRLIPGFFGETELRLNRLLGILGGYRQIGQTLILDRGWDRYNDFQDFRTDNFGQLTISHPYGGVAFVFGRAILALTAGPVRYRTKMEPIAGQAQFSAKTGFAIGLSVGGRLQSNK